MDWMFFPHRAKCVTRTAIMGIAATHDSLRKGTKHGYEENCDEEDIP